MSAEWNVQSALVSSFAALDLGPTSYENREFTPPDDGSLWYEVFTLPGGRDPATLGDGGEDEYVGVFQVDVNGPIGEGVRTIIESASAITAYYTAGRTIRKNGQTVKITRSEMGPARPGESAAVVSVSVYWRAMVPRVGQVPLDEDFG